MTVRLESEQHENAAWNALSWQQRRLVHKRVDRGERLLDGKLGLTWPFHMNLDRFNLANECSCVLGQLAVDIVPKHEWLSGRYRWFTPTYYTALNALALTPVKAKTHGFQADDDCGLSYDAIAYCWRRRIRSRVGR